MMKAWRTHAYGAEGNPADAIAKLVLEEVPIPTAGVGEIQVKVSHAAVNPIDWKLFSGGLHGVAPCAHPYIPGFDIAGTVSAVGEGGVPWVRQHVKPRRHTFATAPLSSPASPPHPTYAP